MLEKDTAQIPSLKNAYAKEMARTLSLSFVPILTLSDTTESVKTEVINKIILASQKVDNYQSLLDLNYTINTIDLKLINIRPQLNHIKKRKEIFTLLFGMIYLIGSTLILVGLWFEYKSK